MKAKRKKRVATDGGQRLTKGLSSLAGRDGRP